jgi:hypothetical protein
VVWNDSPGSSENVFRFRQSFQSARPIRGSLCEVNQQRRFGAGGVVERNHLVENAAVAGFLQVGGHAHDQPERVVVEPAADPFVAALGQWLVLVISSAVFELGCGQIEDALAGALRDDMDEAQQVLGRIAEAHPPPDPGLEL